MATSDSEFFKSIGIDVESSNQSKKASLTEESNVKAVDQVADKLSFTPTTVALGSVAATSIVLGFFGTLALAKKRDGASLDKALLPRQGMSESGTRLALRALGRGTLYAVTGFSVVSFVIYKMTMYRLDQLKERNKVDGEYHWKPVFDSIDPRRRSI